MTDLDALTARVVALEARLEAAATAAAELEYALSSDDCDCAAMACEDLTAALRQPTPADEEPT
jgi:hypothetical protein